MSQGPYFCALTHKKVNNLFQLTSLPEIQLLLSHIIAIPESLVSEAYRPIGITLELAQPRTNLGLD